MLWRTFTVVDVNTATKERVPGLLTAKPVRVSTNPNLAFVFTGQGVQYAKMGMELIQYHIFKQTLQKIDDIFARLGSTWSVFGTLTFIYNIISLSSLS